MQFIDILNGWLSLVLLLVKVGKETTQYRACWKTSSKNKAHADKEKSDADELTSVLQTSAALVKTFCQVTGNTVLGKQLIKASWMSFFPENSSRQCCASARKHFAGLADCSHSRQCWWIHQELYNTFQKHLRSLFLTDATQRRSKHPVPSLIPLLIKMSTKVKETICLHVLLYNHRYQGKTHPRSYSTKPVSHASSGANPRN